MQGGIREIVFGVNLEFKPKCWTVRRLKQLMRCVICGRSKVDVLDQFPLALMEDWVGRLVSNRQRLKVTGMCNNDVWTRHLHMFARHPVGSPISCQHMA